MNALIYRSSLVAAFLGGILALFALSGRGWMLPLPMLSTPAKVGQGDAGGVLLLGVISGFASSCCAPVLVGVLARAGSPLAHCRPMSRMLWPG